MADPNAPKLKVKILKAGRYAGPSVNDPQIETTKDDEEVEVRAAFAAYLVEHGNGEIIAEKGKKKKSTAKNDSPPDADKGNAETK